MNIVRAMIHVAVVVVLVLLGLAMIWSGISSERWAEVIAFVQNSRLRVIWAGLTMFLLGAMMILSGKKPRKGKRFLSFESNGGRVNVSTDAITDYVSRIGEEFPSIIRMKPRVEPARNAIDVVVELKVRTGTQINELCRQLQERIREGMASGLGISQVRRVEVSVRELVDDPGAI